MKIQSVRRPIFFILALPIRRGSDGLFFFGSLMREKVMFIPGEGNREEIPEDHPYLNMDCPEFQGGFCPPMEISKEEDEEE